MRHAIRAAALIFVLAVLGLLVFNNQNLLPKAASDQAGPIDQLFSIHFVLISLLFALIGGLILYSVIFFRRQPGDMEDGPHIVGNNVLELTWTAIPLIIVLALALYGSKVLADTQRVDPKALEVKVIAQQWSWQFVYPDSQITSPDLVLPVNRQVLLRMTSNDVIHSFWVKEFRLKQDIVPGTEQILRVTPDKIGEYMLMCSEICGTRHAYMTAKVKVLSQQDYEAWVTSQTAAVSSDPVERGRKWYQQFGCSGCHSLDGSKLVGPSLKDIYNQSVTLNDGTTVMADEAYCIESIKQPGAKIVQGYPNVMPATLAARMTDDQIKDLVVFIESLK